MSQPASFPIPVASDPPNTTPEAIATAINASLAALLSSNAGTGRPAYAVAGTIWLNTTTGQILMFDGTNDLPIGVRKAAPTAATDPGTTGDITWDADYIYVCTATDTWKRVAIATW